MRNLPPRLKFLLAAASLLGASLCLPLRTNAQQQPDPRRYILFVHTGGAPASPDTLVPDILRRLLQEGYSVRKPDDQRDAVGGSGVDYFSDDDAEAAKRIADVVNSILPEPLKRLEPRRQRVNNPTGYIGLWLF